VLQYKRQNDQKHPLITPFKLQPHALHSNFKPFRVVRISCDDSTNPRPTCRLELEVERRLHRHLVLLLCPHILLQVDSSASALPVGLHIKVCFLFYSPRTLVELSSLSRVLHVMARRIHFIADFAH
jgi:hypothetical protein